MKPLALESGVFNFQNSLYRLDSEGFLVNPEDWDESFAEGLAPLTGICAGLTDNHWKIIKYIRKTYAETGNCPPVYEICRAHGLRLAELKKLFPSGYLRGACRLAGFTYREEQAHSSWLARTGMTRSKPIEDRVYRVNIRGFLISPSEWDEEYAVFKWREMKGPEYLTERHWKIIKYLRKQYKATGKVPTVYETCEVNQLEIEDLEKLFPDGYHRGAVKIAGLRYL